MPESRLGKVMLALLIIIVHLGLAISLPGGNRHEWTTDWSLGLSGEDASAPQLFQHEHHALAHTYGAASFRGLHDSSLGYTRRPEVLLHHQAHPYPQLQSLRPAMAFETADPADLHSYVSASKGSTSTYDGRAAVGPLTLESDKSDVAGKPQLPQDLWTKEKGSKWKMDRNRARFHEPEELRELGYTRPFFSPVRGTRTQFVDSDNEVRSLINKQIFNGKLNWVSFDELSEVVQKSQKMASFKPSRVLPFVEAPGPPEDEARARSIRMVVHGGVGGKDRWRKDHALADKTFYTFWGLPETKAQKGSRPTIQRHGIGFLFEEDFAHVDEHLARMKSAARSHA